MNCDQTIELLPWLLNGTLEEDERRAALDHLKDCAACRQALAETRLAWRIYDQHIPAAALVAHAAGGAAEGIDAEVLAAHLADCPACAAELELARLSRGLVEDESVALLADPARFAGRPAPTRWRAAALAAGVAGLVAFGGWYQSAERARALSARLASAGPQSRTASQTPAPQASQAPAARPPAESAAGPEEPRRVAELERQLATMQKTVDEMQKSAGRAREQLAQLAGRSPLGPQVNTWVGDVRPLGDVVRGAATGATEVPSGATATLLLSAAAELPGEREIEITDAQGSVVWQGRGLRLNAESRDYSLTVPRGALSPGAYTIRLYRNQDGVRSPAESYGVVVR
jgi:Putative zinc-finger